MNSFDYNILLYMHYLSSRSPIFTKAVVGLYGDELKLGFFVALIWWAWFDAKNSDRLEEVREKIVAGLVGGVCSLVIVRLMVTFLPMRVRPLANPALAWHFPIPTGGFANWSSFPSDHAALFTLLTVCLFSISVPLGWLALFDTVFLICMPRVFVGVHYPTDMVVGSLMGLVGGYWVTRPGVRAYLARPVLRWMDVHPASFYASAFLLSFVIAHVFFPILNLALGAKKLVVLSIHAHSVSR